jgi:thioredoxin reductase (NADPH)
MQSDTQLQFEKTRPVGSNHDYDIVVVGAGPAGMSAAICAARAQLKVVILDKALPGGEASTAYRVDNYLGFPGGIMGVDLARQMEDHMNTFDIEFVCATVDDVQSMGPFDKRVSTDMGRIFLTKCVILAVGLEPKLLNSPFEKRFLGRGVSYYAQGDGKAYQGQHVAVIGGGNCACYAAEYLAEHVDRLYLIHRSGHIKAVKSLHDKILNNPRIQPIWNSEVEDAFGVDKVEKIKVYNHVTGQSIWLDVKCIFVYAGRVPPKEILNLNLKLDEDGYIITDECMRTSVPGIYSAGDARSKQIRQIITAVSDGMIAAINAARDSAGVS